VRILDPLDLGVESFGYGIDDAVNQIGKDVLQVASE
jgi:hypothetical protein